MIDPDPITPGQVLTGPLFSEPMRVETVIANGPTTWVVGLVGVQSERFRKVTLTVGDLERLAVLDAQHSFDGDGRLLRLGLQAYALGIAYEFDPYFGLSISRVDPLPHQLEAVYDYLLKLARVRFLLADDAGAGKTIMSGLLVRELALRGLAERILIVCPANLAFQWQREMKEKFDTTFLVMKGQDLREQFGVNQWLERPRVITSLDLAKRADILPGLQQVHWDLVIVDEAHRMSASDESHKSLRYKLGELLRDTSDHLLLLTATPHRGDPQNFSLFLQLLDADCYADVTSIREAMHRRRAPFYLRRTKELRSGHKSPPINLFPRFTTATPAAACWTLLVTGVPAPRRPVHNSAEYHDRARGVRSMASLAPSSAESRPARHFVAWNGTIGRGLSRIPAGGRFGLWQPFWTACGPFGISKFSRNPGVSEVFGSGMIGSGGRRFAPSPYCQPFRVLLAVFWPIRTRWGSRFAGNGNLKGSPQFRQFVSP